MEAITKRRIGASLIALPFIAVFVLSIYFNGVKATFIGLAALAALVAIIALGVNLYYSENEDTNSGRGA